MDKKSLSTDTMHKQQNWGGGGGIGGQWGDIPPQSLRPPLISQQQEHCNGIPVYRTKPIFDQLGYVGFKFNTLYLNQLKLIQIFRKLKSIPT